jgi:carboxyl-terminal processing protease
MKIKTALLFFSLLLFCSAFTGQSLRNKAIVLKRMIELNHYSPRPVNDSFSVDLFRSFFRSADPKAILFTAAEFQQLAAYQYKLDDELNGGEWKFFDAFIPLYKKALTRADSLINAVSQKPFDFNANETVVSFKEPNFIYSSDLPAIANRWMRGLKYKVLMQLYDEAGEDSTGKTTIKSLLPKREAAVRELVKRKEQKTYSRMLASPQEMEKDLADLYLNTIATRFDPHSNYFSAREKQDFIEELSTQEESFGVEWDEDEDGKITADHLTPGGPAWKSGELNKGDELIKIQWGKDPPIDVAGMDLEEIYKLMDRNVNASLTLTYKKANGATNTVTLFKEKIDNEENIVKSFILSGPRKIGYIMLPGFYTEWENEASSSCANDVAKEIVKLKRENIDGLILDLRFNGGGSLGEAMDLIGIFINEGPLSAVKEKTGKLQYLKDPNRGTIYDGPLAVMINPASASASEMVSASLQDYNRALIVGSNSYGKATMQQMIVMDTLRTANKTQIPKGQDAVKITMGKLYRLNGNTTQRQGVVPDVKLPDMMDGMEISESREKNALPADTAAKNNYYKPLKPLPVSQISDLNKKRTASSNYYKLVQSFIDYAKKEAKAGSVTIPLKADAFEAWIKQREKELDMPELDETGDIVVFKPGNHAMDAKWIEKSDYSKAINKNWLEKLQEDLELSETYLIICDLINLLKTPN